MKIFSITAKFQDGIKTFIAIGFDIFDAMTRINYHPVMIINSKVLA